MARAAFAGPEAQAAPTALQPYTYPCPYPNRDADPNPNQAPIARWVGGRRRLQAGAA